MIDKSKLIDALYEACEKDSFKELPSWIINVINKQEEVDNTANFKHFKLHSDSTLKSNFTKDELISYIHTVHYNWKITDWSWEIMRRNAEYISGKYDKLKKDFESVCCLHDDLLKMHESLQRDYKQLKEDYESLKEENKQFKSLSKAKKLIEHVSYEDDHHLVKMYKCPTCGSIKTNLLDKHCTECGQRFVE